MIKQAFGFMDRMNMKIRKGLGLDDGARIRGRVKFTLRKADGTVETWSKNDVVASGKEYVAGLLELASGTKMDYMELGTGTAAVNQADTELDTPLVPSSRKALTSTIRNGAQVTFRADWGVGEAIGLLTEAGLFNSPTPGGPMLSRSVFVGKQKDSADSITVEWVITVGP